MGLKPVFKILANDVDVTAAIADRLVQLTITDNAGHQSDTLELTVENTDEKLELPADGVELEAWIGYDDTVQNMGIFVVDEIAVEGPPSIVKVTARGAPFKPSRTFGSIQTHKTRSWDNVTLGELAEKIASEHGLQAAIDSTLAGRIIVHADQFNESDINLLTRLAEERSATVKPAGGRLIIVQRGAGLTARGKTIGTVTVRKSEVSKYGLTYSKRGRYRRVVAVYRDVAAGLDKEVEVGAGEPCCRLKFIYPDLQAASDACLSKIGRFRRGAGKASISMAGRTDIMAEGRLRFAGFPAGFDGDWQITSVAHSIAPANGYTLTLEAETLSLEEGEPVVGPPVVGGGAIDGGDFTDTPGETVP